MRCRIEVLMMSCLESWVTAQLAATIKDSNGDESHGPALTGQKNRFVFACSGDVLTPHFAFRSSIPEPGKL
jgi:hypothetical protein